MSKTRTLAMLRKLFLIFILFIFAMPLEAKFLIIPLKKRHKEISNKVFSVINSKEAQWQIRGSYPLEFDRELIFFFIPENQTQKNWNKQYTVHEVLNPDPTMLEDKKEFILRSTDLPHYSKLSILAETDNDFIYELYVDLPQKRSSSGYEIGLVEILPDNRSWYYQYYQKKGIPSEAEKESLIDQFKMMRKIINNT